MQSKRRSRKSKPKRLLPPPTEGWYPPPFDMVSDHCSLTSEQSEAIMNAMPQLDRWQSMQVLRRVEEAIALYRWRKPDWRSKPTRREIQEALERVSEKAAEFALALSNLDYFSLTLLLNAAAGDKTWGDEQPQDPGHLRQNRLMRLAQSADAGARWAEMARDRAPRPSKGRKPDGPLHNLVADLGIVWTEFTGLRFARSSNREQAPDFVRAVLRIADPEISPDIDSLMRAIQKKI